MGAYRQMFRGVSARIVLDDLSRFCHANKTVHVVGDTHGTAQLEGRRQVWLRIQQALNLSDDKLQEIARGVQED